MNHQYQGQGHGQGQGQNQASCDPRLASQHRPLPDVGETESQNSGSNLAPSLPNQDQNSHILGLGNPSQPTPSSNTIRPPHRSSSGGSSTMRHHPYDHAGRPQTAPTQAHPRRPTTPGPAARPITPGNRPKTPGVTRPLTPANITIPQLGQTTPTTVHPNSSFLYHANGQPVYGPTTSDKQDPATQGLPPTPVSACGSMSTHPQQQQCFLEHTQPSTANQSRPDYAPNDVYQPTPDAAANLMHSFLQQEQQQQQQPQHQQQRQRQQHQQQQQQQQIQQQLQQQHQQQQQALHTPMQRIKTPGPSQIPMSVEKSSHHTGAQQQHQQQQATPNRLPRTVTPNDNHAAAPTTQAPVAYHYPQPFPAPHPATPWAVNNGGDPRRTMTPIGQFGHGISPAPGPLHHQPGPPLSVDWREQYEVINGAYKWEKSEHAQTKAMLDEARAHTESILDGAREEIARLTTDSEQYQQRQQEQAAANDPRRVVIGPNTPTQAAYDELLEKNRVLNVRKKEMRGHILAEKQISESRRIKITSLEAIISQQSAAPTPTPGNADQIKELETQLQVAKNETLAERFKSVNSRHLIDDAEQEKETLKSQVNQLQTVNNKLQGHVELLQVEQRKRHLERTAQATLAGPSAQSNVEAATMGVDASAADTDIPMTTDHHATTEKGDMNPAEIDNLRAINTDLNARLKDAQGRVTELEALNAQLSNSQARATASEAPNTETNDELKRSRTLVAELGAEVQHSRRRVTELEAEILDLGAELEDPRARVAELEVTVKDLKAELADCRMPWLKDGGQGDQTRFEGLIAAYDQLILEKAKIQEELKQAKEEIARHRLVQGHQENERVIEKLQNNLTTTTAPPSPTHQTDPEVDSETRSMDVDMDIDVDAAADADATNTQLALRPSTPDSNESGPTRQSILPPSEATNHMENLIAGALILIAWVEELLTMVPLAERRKKKVTNLEVLMDMMKESGAYLRGPLKGSSMKRREKSEGKLGSPGPGQSSGGDKEREFEVK